MSNFIKATEIWIPNHDKTELSLQSGLYGDNKELEEYSQNITFAYNDGLPGKAWAEKHPIILTNLGESFFKRTELVTSMGLTCAIAMPIFLGEYLQAVVVFLCGDNEEHAGAIEVWKAVEDRLNEMGLVEGYYGTMEDFEWISKSIKIMKGQGLPGGVWKSKEPMIMKDLSQSATFMRAKKAAKEGITTALAIPAWIYEKDAYVMTFLSAKGTPIARRFEIWEPNNESRTLSFKDGYSHGNKDLVELYENVEISKEDPILGKVWKTACPVLTKNDTMEYAPGDCDNVLALPILENGFCKAVIAFYY
jgi:hypothetical protein